MIKKEKAFTLIELLVVIAIVAVLSVVGIVGYNGFIKKAEDSVYLQEKTQQQIADLAERVDNLDLLTWDDVEDRIEEGINSAKTATPVATEINYDYVKALINNAVNGINNSLLTREQIELIVLHSLKDVNTGLTEDQIKEIVGEAIENALNDNMVQEVNLSTIDSICNGGEFVLSSNIDVGNSIKIDESVNCSLDLNGKTVTTIGEYDSFVVNSNSSLSFSNGTIVNNAKNETEDNPKYAITGYNGSTIILDGVKITGDNNRSVGVFMGTVIVSCSNSQIDGYIFVDLGTVVLAHEGTYRITSEMIQLGISPETSITSASGYNIVSKIQKNGSDGIKYIECVVVKN